MLSIVSVSFSPKEEDESKNWHRLLGSWCTNQWKRKREKKARHIKTLKDIEFLNEYIMPALTLQGMF